MSATATQTPPPLVFASRAACEQALTILPEGRILEVEVARGLKSDYWRASPRGKERLVVVGGFSAVATVRPTRSPMTGRPGWLVTEVRPGRLKLKTLRFRQLQEAREAA